MGWGDEIMATAQARHYHMVTKRRVAFGSGRKQHWSPVFENNPRILGPGEADASSPWIANYPGCRPYLDYDAMLAAGRRVLSDPQAKRKRILQAGERLIPKPGFKAVPGEIFFSEAELAWADGLDADYVVVEPNVKAIYPNKAWGLENYQAVCDAIIGARPLQMSAPGAANDLDGVGFAATPTFRDALVVLSKARAYLGPEGGLHHAAAALGIPAVVIFGGMASPSITGYPAHTNFAAGGEPCGRISPCEHCAAAMAAIEPADVAAALNQLLQQSTGENNGA